LARVYDTMTNEILLRYLREEFLPTSDFESVKPTGQTVRFVYLETSSLTNMHLNQLERHALSFRSASKTESGYRLFCYFRGEVTDEQIEFSSGTLDIVYE
jgi:hypothetical protein